MQKNLLLYAFLILLASCSKDKNYLDLSTDPVFNLNANEHVLRIGVQSDSEWDVTNRNTWCTVMRNASSGNDSLVITVQTNIAREKRSGELAITNKDKNLTISINQTAATGEYHFKIPVIFHVLYTDASDPKTNIPTHQLSQILDEINSLYDGSIPGSVNMNLEFTLATHDPGGNPLSEAGIHRIQRNNIKLSYDNFLNNKYGDAQWLWDQNKYINVVIFTFEERGVVGVTFLAYTPSSHPLEDLPKGDAYYTRYPTDQAHCIAMNNFWVNWYDPTPEGDQSVFSHGLAHELGHYLGLRHAFYREGDDTDDYCDDTPNYDRTAYETTMQKNAPWEERIQRIAFDGTPFISTNIMDYDYGWKNLFTPDQRARVRHVLEYSPLIPGPKIPTSLTRGAGITEPGIIME